MLTDRAHFRLQLGACIVGALLLGVSYISHVLFAEPDLSAFVSLSAAVLLGAPLVISALRDLWLNRIEMNELAALSFLVSLGSSQYKVAAIIALFLFGSQLIEYQSEFGARKSLESLFRLTPRKASVRTADGFVEVEATALVEGDVVEVRPWNQIPGDGTVVDGFSMVDQATITGESLPVEKRAGDAVFAGTINQAGLLFVRITAQVGDSTLANIQGLIKQAEENRPPATRLINRYVGWYTPIILMCTAIVLFFTHDVDRAISMLIVACPCTIILASPTALVAALSAASRLGVIIKDLHLLEVANRVDTVIFDKTGTLTTGQLALTSISVNGRLSEADLLSLAASLEQYSAHPVAKAIMLEVRNRNIRFPDAQDVLEKPGLGITGKVNGFTVSLGQKAWIDQFCFECPMEERLDEDSTTLHIARDKDWVGSLHFSDRLRPDAKDAVQSLKCHPARKILILTGDRDSVARSIAEQLTCDVESQVMPGQKMERVEEARRNGAVVAVIGDGVNDAPALAAGDISIAMGAAGSDVAVHSANVVLMNNKLNRIPFIFELSRRVVATIRQNLISSTLFIAVLFWLSAGGNIPPVLAAVLHTSSSLFVVFNSARLLRVGEEIP